MTQSELSSQPVIVLDTSGYLQGFSSLEYANSAMELMEDWVTDDSSNAEIFMLDGRRIEVELSNMRDPKFVVVGRPDREYAIRRILTARNLTTIKANPNDLGSLLVELRVHEWESRWPKWPRWLSRRLHGPKPEGHR